MDHLEDCSVEHELGKKNVSNSFPPAERQYADATGTYRKGKGDPTATRSRSSYFLSTKITIYYSYKFYLVRIIPLSILQERSNVLRRDHRIVNKYEGYFCFRLIWDPN
jgi:hypothetical protein